jgi:hypothetical protein
MAAKSQDDLPAFLGSKYCHNEHVLFRSVKSELTDFLLSQDSFKMSLEGVIRTVIGLLRKVCLNWQ